MMMSHNISKARVGSEGSHPRIGLNKLHFDFRNAKPAFLGTVPSYCKLDDVRTKSEVQQTELSCSQSSIQVEHNRVDVLKHVNAAGADSEHCKTRQTVTRSAIQVDDGDLDRLFSTSNAAASPLQSCSAVTISEPNDRDHTIITTEYTQSTDGPLPNHSLHENKTLPPPSEACSLLSSLLKEPINFCDRKPQKPRHTVSSISEDKTDARPTDSVTVKQLSVHVNELGSRKANTQLASHTTSCNTSVVSTSSGINAESSLPSGMSSMDVYDYALFDDRWNDWKKPSQSTSRVKKSVRSKKNARAVDIVTGTSVSVEAKCKDSKPKAVRTTRRRQKVKSDWEDDVWLTHKKLLLLPVDKKSSNSGRGRKQSSCMKRDIFGPVSKRKRRKSVTGMELPMMGMELPDLSTTLDSSADDIDLSDALKLYGWESNVSDNNNTNATRKWCVDITGADLSMDLDVGCEQKVTDVKNQKRSLITGNLVTDSVAEQNVNQPVHHNPTDAECCRTNFSGSQETPPPSVASDGFSSCDESDKSVKLDTQNEETRQSSSGRWLTVDTKLARYIDGRRFDRLVNGISVQIPATLTQETVGQIGQEAVHLEKLTKRELKELQNQVRLEEIYHRRAKKSVHSPHNIFIERVKRGAFRRHGVSNIVRRSASKLAAEFHQTDDDGADCESAEVDVVIGDHAPVVVDEVSQSAAESDNDTLSYLSSDDNDTNDTAETGKFTPEPDGMYTSELLGGNVTENTQRADDGCANTDGTTQKESPAIRVLIRRRPAAHNNQSLMQDQLTEPPSVNVSAHEQTPAPSNSSTAETVQMSDSPPPGDCMKAASRRKSSARKRGSLLKRTGFRPAASEPADNSMQHAVTDAVTNVSDTVAAVTDDSEYIAAIALASLSVPTESSETALNHCQTSNEHRVTETDSDIAGVSKAVCESSPQYPTKQCSATTSDTKPLSSKPSKCSVLRNGHHNSKDVAQRGHRVSADKHTSKSGGDSVTEVRMSEGQRSSQRSHSRDEKRITRCNENLSPTQSSESTINSNDDSCCVATDNENKHNAEENIQSRRSRRRRSHSAKAEGDQKQILPVNKSLSATPMNNDSGSSNLPTSTVNEKSAELKSANIEDQKSQSSQLHSAKKTAGDQKQNSSFAVNRHSGSSHLGIRKVNEKSAELNIEHQRSQSRKSYSAMATGDQKQNSPVSYLQQSSVNNDSRSIRVANGKVNEHKTKMDHAVHDNFSENSSCSVSDKTRHRKHRSGHRHGVEKKATNRHEKVKVAGDNLAMCDASATRQTKVQSKVDSDHYDVDASLVRSDVPECGESASPFDNSITTSSAKNCTATSMLPTSVPSQSLMSSSSSSSLAAQCLMSSKDVVECSDNRNDNTRPEKISLGSQEIHVTKTLSLTSSDHDIVVQAGQTEVITIAGGHQASSNLNSNSCSKSSPIQSIAVQKQPDDSRVARVLSSNADTSVVLSAAVIDAEVTPDSCVLARNNDTTVLSPNSFQSLVISADFMAESPVSPYRESEDIRSPSPLSLDMDEDDRTKEIRSPSPCELESPAGRYRIVETSWDVRLTSPCEIQSPDVSDDEAGNSVEEFGKHCNVCLHHGPVTIPLTITEASKTVHNQQLDMM